MRRPHRPTGKPRGGGQRLPIRATNPIIVKLCKEIDRRGISVISVERGSGVSHKAISNWRRGLRVGNLANVEAVLNYLGLDLVVKEMGK